LADAEALEASGRVLQLASRSIFFFLIALSGYFYPIYSDGFSGEYLVTQRWRDVQSRYSPLTNPAFITEENYVSVRLCDALVMETFNLLETGITIPIGSSQALGVSYFSENSGKIQGMAWGGSSGDSMMNLPNNSSPSNSSNLAMFSYANNLLKNFSLGINFSVSYQTNFNTQLDSAVINTAADIGISYRLMLNPVLGEHLLGVSIQNIVAARTMGKLSYPSGIKFSCLSYFLDRQIEAGLDLNALNVAPSLLYGDKSNPIEYDFSFRLGVWIFNFLNAYLVTGTNYYGFCGGVNFPGSNNGRDFAFLYQFITMTQAESVTSHSAYIRMQFGRHREDAYAQHMARSADQSPVELFGKAYKLYSADKYWDAFFVFGSIQSQYPSFVDNDWVANYKALCLENLGMRDAARAAYNKVKLDFPKSRVVPHADLGIMRLCHSDASDSLESVQFALLDNQDTPDSLKFHGYYLMAETLMRHKALTAAQALFSSIPETHPDRLFALHSLAIAFVMADKTDSALSALVGCTEASPRSAASREIINRSYLMLGLMFYEKTALAKSVSALRMVPKNSIYYENALLTLCWAALRAGQWNDCIESGQLLQKISAKSAFQCEGALIEGYANLMRKNYKQAFEVLREAQTKSIRLRSPSADSVKSRRANYFAARKSYDSLARTADKIAGVFQSSSVLRQIDSLHALQTASLTELMAFYAFMDEVGSKSFTRAAEAIRSDIDYALATSQKFVQQSPKAEIQQKMETKQKEIDERIEKLKKEMNNLNDKK
jgi:tetratricopeptide (TPR) repeat protein